MLKFCRNDQKESKEQKKNKGSVLAAESAYNAQNAQFGLVMKGRKKAPLNQCFLKTLEIVFNKMMGRKLLGSFENPSETHSLNKFAKGSAITGSEVFINLLLLP